MVLGSGLTGSSVLICIEKTKVLVDVGLSIYFERTSSQVVCS